MLITRRTTLVAAAALLTGCARSQSRSVSWTDAPQTGEGRIEVPGGSVVWRKFGGGGKTPILAAHGGPGYPSDYIEPLKGLGDERAVYFWDQLGCGRSDRVTGAQYWVIDRFVEELARVREGLGLTEMHYFGSSWGTMLGVQYLLERGQGGVASATLDGPVISVRRYLADVGPMVEQLSTASRDAVHEADRTGVYDTPGYAAANEEFMAAHIARHPTPETEPYWRRATEGVGIECYRAMNGPSEFSITGNIRDFERENDLTAITMPVLFMSGEYDTCTPDASRAYAAKTPSGEVQVVPDAGHCVHIDSPDAANAAIRAFLTRVEGA
jgi:proline iminopeptidase